MSKSIPIEEVSEKFAEMIHGIIEQYASKVELQLDSILKESADELKDDLYQATPVSDTDGGEYGHLRDNLRRRKSTRGGELKYIVDFGKKGFLSTLLEYGWRMKNGKFVPPKTFIVPTFKKNKEKYYNLVKYKVQEVAKENAT